VGPDGRRAAAGSRDQDGDLDKKSETEGIKLPADVRIFIATKTKSNVRELEGALVKLMAYSSVTGSPITLAMAQQILKHLTHARSARSRSNRS